MGIKISSQKVKEAIINILDENGNGKIELSEVLSAIGKLKAIVEEIKGD